MHVLIDRYSMHHEVCSMPHVLGTKYRYAKQWGIHCVSVQWFHDSVDGGYSMPEGEYDVDKEQGEAGVKGEESTSGTSRKRYVSDE